MHRNKSNLRKAKRKKAKTVAEKKALDVGSLLAKSSLLKEGIQIEVEEAGVSHSLYNTMEWEVEEEEEEEEEMEDEEEELKPVMKPEHVGLSAKQIRLLSRPSVVHLKSVAVHSDVVESWDVTSKEPGLLVALKSWPNTVGIPSHWNSKRRYLAGKRGIDKGSFKLPDHIEQTKISEIRAALVAKEGDMTMKQKLRARARPKGQRMDIDYQTLHDAFFRYAVKPPMTTFGQLYYEGREQEMKFSRYKTGQLTDRLREALGMLTPSSPTPWLFNMQRYGPPPAYHGLRVPGVNCPIPKGAEYGYHINGWGMAPTDASGAPLWGDLGPATVTQDWDQGPWTEYLWGEMEDVVDMEVEDMDSDEGPVEEEREEAVLSSASSVVSGSLNSGVLSSSGVSTPSVVNLRKGLQDAQGGALGATAYKVLEPQAVDLDLQKSQFFASSTLYDVQGAMDTVTEQAKDIDEKQAASSHRNNAREPPKKKRFKF